MTLAQKIQNLERKKQIIMSSRDNALRVAALDTTAAVSMRIFTKGGAQKGQIGKYSTKKTVASKSQFVKKAAFKKDGFIRFPNRTKATAIMELPNGYKQLRSIQGRPTNTVNLDYSSATRKDFENSVRKLGNGYAAIVKRDLSAKIIEGQEARFKKKIFALTKKEAANYKQLLTKKVMKWIS